jgi:hypothetical protein
MVGGCIHASRVGSDAFCIAGLHLLLEDGLAGKNTVGNFFWVWVLLEIVLEGEKDGLCSSFFGFGSCWR